ncbi:MAG: hypothetical protein AAFV86_21300, partial [Pseudomonadota bacterium]
ASAFGQKDAFSNSTTLFDGIEFSLKRLIRDPSDPKKFRMVANLTNLGDDRKWALLSLPIPSLIDELGNTYTIDLRAGMEACRANNRKWAVTPNTCDDEFERVNASLLAKGLPANLMLRFLGAPDEGFEPELADIANTANLTISFLVSQDGFQDQMTLHTVTIPNIPLPRN